MTQQNEEWKKLEEKWLPIIQSYDRGIGTFDVKKMRTEAERVGHNLNDKGGIDLMISVHSQFHPHMKRTVELFWGGIGEWYG